MNTMELINQDSYVGTIIKWTSLFISLVLCATSMNTLRQQELQKLTADMDLLNQKSSLIFQMHQEMLSMSRMQLQILHASNEEEVRKNLKNLSQLISDHLIHYHQLQSITSESDAPILMRFRIAFEQWHGFNRNLLAYANVVSDTGFINTLNKVDLAFPQFDSSSDEKRLLNYPIKIVTN